MEHTQAGNERVTTVLMDERVYDDLSIAVRVLMAVYANQVPSGNEGVLSFEIALDHWNEIKSALARFEPPPDATNEGFVLVTYYANDYCCSHDDATWCLHNCSSAEPDECPVCCRATEAITSERYIVIRHAAGNNAVENSRPERRATVLVPSASDSGS